MPISFILFYLYQKCVEGFQYLAYFITSCYLFWNVEMYIFALMETNPSCSNFLEGN